jgi:putative sigma-54 modulation protein
MRLQVKAVHDSLPDPVKPYLEKRLAKLERRLYADTLVEVTFGREKNPSIADDHWAEAIVYTKGPNIVARKSAPSFEAAIDELVEKLERQVERYRDKRVEKPRRDARKREEPSPAPIEQIAEDLGPGDDEAAA